MEFSSTMDFITIFIISVVQLCGCCDGNPAVFNILDYGAVGDGRADDSQALVEAWNATCQANAPLPVLQFPANKLFLLSPVVLSGPCIAPSVQVQVLGNIVAPQMTNPTWKALGRKEWIQFSYVNGLIVNGNGKLDGQGQEWWNLPCIHHSTSFYGTLGDKDCFRPQFIAFHNCNGLQLYGLTIVDTPRNHISINGCSDVMLHNLTLRAPATSPNTDGIDISDSTRIQILDSFIGTGDDCIAINGGSSYINITNIACGPGHGISIGSLGAGGAYDTVENVNVKNCNLTGTENGVRIKTWQGGSGYARYITFEQIGFSSVKNPIIIDQYYTDDMDELQDAVIVSDITYTRIYGTSSTKDAIVLKCSNVAPCTGITMDHVDIETTGCHAICINAQGQATSTTPPVKCLR